MSLMLEQNALETAGVVATDRREGLSALLNADCAAATWQRRLPQGVQSWIDGLSPEQLPSGRVVLKPESVRSVADQLCEGASTPRCAERDSLVDDIAGLAATFAHLMTANWLRMRLDIITTNACRRFHVDAVTARLICTYRGDGTQFGASPDGSTPERILEVPTGAPIVLRGTSWPERPRSGLLHRSPPIEGTGVTRLVLVLDPLDSPEEAM